MQTISQAQLERIVPESVRDHLKKNPDYVWVHPSEKALVNWDDDARRWNLVCGDFSKKNEAEVNEEIQRVLRSEGF